ncbi:hypothetical protein OG897_16295 [Streptomyces sp. NBC_00237]|uniref:hypothetical protein n=1 Tax=Streptomyces sp. NBC_00237 TaxID=2975687 RepID=UPI00225519C4|nr:hypothetical protein [Streptomyces sp. NBC_00237]MCX5203002.1 hypothetical protein [Streptomyces sp. NBC_00237]
MISRHNGVQEAPVVLDIDPYLYGCTPAPGCGVCTALAKQLDKGKTHEERFDAATEIRNHPHAEVVK